jgi:hypothetical protein
MCTGGLLSIYHLYALVYVAAWVSLRVTAFFGQCESMCNYLLTVCYIRYTFYSRQIFYGRCHFQA